MHACRKDTSGASSTLDGTLGRTGIAQSIRDLDEAYCKEPNRLVRTRMLGGVGGVPGQPGPLSRCTPDMGVNLWGASPLYENGNRLEGSIPNVAPIDKVLGEGNCGRATDRGVEACEWVCVSAGLSNAAGPHSRQSCEATNRNAIQAERDPEVS